MLRKSRLGVRPSTSIVTHSPCKFRLSKLSTSAEQPKTVEENSSPSPSTFPTNPTMIFVRPWDTLPTMAHVFSIVRDIEKRFGRIDDIIVPRDSDLPSNYGPYFIANFAWEEDAKAIPPEGKVIQVPVPKASEYRQGGIGLSDLEPYLDAALRRENLQQKTDAEATTNPDNPNVVLMDVKVERARLHYPPRILEYTNKHRRVNPFFDKSLGKAQELALAIVGFGGFTNTALPPNAPPSSFARVVQSWSNVMTTETRSRLLKQGDLQVLQSVEETQPQYPNVHGETDATTFSAEANSSDPNDAILESADESVLIPESTSTKASAIVSEVEPSIRQIPTSPSTYSLPISPSTYSIPTLSTPSVANITKLAPKSISKSPSSKTRPPTQPASSQPQVPKMSRSERTLLAVREAAKAAAMREKMWQTSTNPVDSTTSHSAAEGPTTIETPSTPNESEGKDSSKDSGNWWSFLTGKDKAKQ